MSEASENIVYNEWVAPDFSLSSNQESMDISRSSRLPTADDIQNIYKQAYDEGFSKGYQDGISSANNKITEKKALIEGVINKIDAPYKKISEDVVDNLLEVAIIIAAQIIRREITIDNGNIISVIQRSIDSLRNVKGRLSIYANPQDVPVISEEILTNESENIKVIEDPSIQRGGCRVETESANIDATIEEQLRIIAAEIIGGSRLDDD